MWELLLWDDGLRVDVSELHRSERSDPERTNLQEKSEWDETVNSLNMGILTLTVLHVQPSFRVGEFYQKPGR